MFTPPRKPSARPAQVVAVLLLIEMLTGCAGVPGIGSGIAAMALPAIVGTATITAEEQAKYAAQSCPQLQETITGYRTGLSMSASNPNSKPGQAAQVQSIIKPRLTYLEQLYQTKC